MLLQKAKYKKVKVWQSQMITEDIYGCDVCQKVIDFNKDDASYLSLDIHHNHSPYENRHYCSWECCLEDLPKLSTDYFISNDRDWETITF